MYTRLLYTQHNNPTKNIEVRRYKCGHYYVRSFITSYSGKFIFEVAPFQRTTLSKLLELLEWYDIYFSEEVQ